MKVFDQMLDKWHGLISIKRNWSMLTPKRKFQIFYELGKKSGYLIGLRVFGDAKFTLYTSMLGFILVLYFLLSIHTIIFHARNGHFIDGLTCLSIAGIYVSVR